MLKTVISANKRTIFNFRELAEYKELIMQLALRDFKVRYAHAWLGLLWAFIQPLVTLLISILIFSKGMKVQTGSVPYPVYSMLGLSAWTYFAFVLTQSGTSLISAQNLITKVYFPRLVMPISRAIVGLIDLSITLLILGALMIMYKVVPSHNIIFLPLLILLVIIVSISVGIWASALTIRFRDIQYIIPFIVQIGLYVTPVLYPSNLVPAKYALVYHLNPMAGIVDAFRWSVLGIPFTNVNYFIMSLVMVFLLLFSGIYYFRSVEDLFADIV
jgi:lipopolysaccharide transport system permease protein